MSIMPAMLTMSPRRIEHWNTDAPGLFARVAELSPEEAESLLGRAAPQGSRPLTLADNWTEVIAFAWSAAAYFEDISAGLVDHHLRAEMSKRLAVRTARALLHGCLANGEFTADIEGDLNLHVAALSVRAALVGEAAQAIREGWSFRRCSFCGGWHRVVRSRHETSFCIPAHGRAYREEQANAK